MQGSGHRGAWEQSVSQSERRMVFLKLSMSSCPASVTASILLLILLSRTEARPLPAEDDLEIKLVYLVLLLVVDYLLDLILRID